MKPGLTASPPASISRLPAAALPPTWVSVSPSIATSPV